MKDSKFYGNVIYRFKVCNDKKVVIYQCVTSTRQIHDIIEELNEMFKPTYKKYFVYCNGDLVYVINPPYKNAKYKQRIRDKQTGYVYVGLWEFKEDLQIKTNDKAYNIIKNNRRYEYIYRD